MLPGSVLTGIRRRQYNSECSRELGPCGVEHAIQGEAGLLLEHLAADHGPMGCLLLRRVGQVGEPPLDQGARGGSPCRNQDGDDPPGM